MGRRFTPLWRVVNDCLRGPFLDSADNALQLTYAQKLSTSQTGNGVFQLASFGGEHLFTVVPSVAVGQVSLETLQKLAHAASDEVLKSVDGCGSLTPALPASRLQAVPPGASSPFVFGFGSLWKMLVAVHFTCCGVPLHGFVHQCEDISCWRARVCTDAAHSFDVPSRTGTSGEDVGATASISGNPEYWRGLLNALVSSCTSCYPCSVLLIEWPSPEAMPKHRADGLIPRPAPRKCRGPLALLSPPPPPPPSPRRALSGFTWETQRASSNYCD